MISLFFFCLSYVHSHASVLPRLSLACTLGTLLRIRPAQERGPGCAALITVTKRTYIYRSGWQRRRQDAETKKGNGN